MTLKKAMQLQSVLAEVRKETPDMPLQQLYVLLAVYMDEGVGHRDLQMRLDMTKSAENRNVLALCRFAGDGREGLGFIVQRPNPNNIREHLLYLTDTGKQYIENILSKWE